MSTFLSGRFEPTTPGIRTSLLDGLKKAPKKKEAPKKEAPKPKHTFLTGAER